MTQHDFEFADQLFPAMRTDMNNALIALSTRQAGTGAPALVAAARPNRLYVDITRKQVLIRDNADTTDFVWDSWGQDRLRYVYDADLVFLPEDVNRLLVMNGPNPRNAFLQPPVGNFAPSWNAELFNLGSNYIYLYPPNGYTVNGSTTYLLLEPKQGMRIFSSQNQYLCSVTGQGTVTQAQLSAAMAANTIPTGTIMGYLHTNNLPAGWVRLYGGTMGNATSGASERANADTWPLYNLLWVYMADAQAPVAGGRGSSADYDFNRSAYITLPDMRGRTLFGYDAGVGRLTYGAPGGINGNVMGAAGGEQMHTLTASEIPPHQHAINAPSFADISIGGGPYALHFANTTTPVGTDGGLGVYGYAHNTVPPGIAMGVWIMKL